MKPQVKFLTDGYPGGYANGLSMLDSDTMNRFKVVLDDDSKTVLETEDGIVLTYHHPRISLPHFAGYTGVSPVDPTGSQPDMACGPDAVTGSQPDLRQFSQNYADVTGTSHTAVKTDAAASHPVTNTDAAASHPVTNTDAAASHPVTNTDVAAAHTVTMTDAATSPVREHITTITNNSDKPVTLEMLTSFCIPDLKADRLYRMSSFWSAEGRLREDKLSDLNMEVSWAGHGTRVEKFGSVGSMPVRGFFPFAALEDSTSGKFTAVCIYSPSSWQIELMVRRSPLVTLAGGQADGDFGHWTKILSPGESFTAPKALSAEGSSLNEVCDLLLKAQIPQATPEASTMQATPEASTVPTTTESPTVQAPPEAPALQASSQAVLASTPDADSMGITFNEYCTTWGDPTIENMKRICDKLSDKGIRYLVMDSGWYLKKGENWWDHIGKWEVNSERFPNGLKELTSYIRSHGMIPGIWFEPESVAWGCELYNNPEYLLTRNGAPVTVGGKRFFDMEKPCVRDYLREKVIRLLKDNDFGYIKIDYNDTIGMGCDGYESPGEGLRRKLLASQDFFKELKREIPGLVIENCSSGGHRLEPSMMALADMASFSDAHEALCVPLIAANLTRLVRSEKNQIWAVMRKDDSDARIFYSLCSTFMGRIGMSGDIYELSDHQWELIDEGISFYREAADIIRYGTLETIETNVTSYNDPHGYQFVLKSLGTKSLAIMHRFKGSDYTMPKNALTHRRIVREYGDISTELSAKAWILEYAREDGRY